VLLVPKRHQCLRNPVTERRFASSWHTMVNMRLRAGRLSFLPRPFCFAGPALEPVENSLAVATKVRPGVRASPVATRAGDRR
jgi:hypothetical protein